MSGLRVVINGQKNFSKSQVEKYDKACRKVEHSMNSVEFRSEVIRQSFTNSKGLNSLQIYQMIMNGAEVLSPEPDGEIDVMIEMYHKNNRVVGYTKPSTLWIWVNQKFFNTFDEAEVAGNLVHEWLHKLGFDHSSASDKNSVPYRIGYIVRDLIKDVDNGRILSPLMESYEAPPVITVAPKKMICRRYWFFWKRCSYE